MEKIPKTGIEGLVENWQSDLIAAISVAMVALPLGLSIALASGFPPITGILSAIIGGLVTTLFRGSHLGINGPAAGLIAVILGSIAALDDGSGQALNYVMAAVVVSGAILVLLGLFKLGQLADIFHSSVIRGILAAIGVIIVAKQIHIALGTEATSNTVIESLIDVFRHITDINPFVAIISLMGLLLLLFHSRISYRFFHFLPAPMWVLVLSIPFVYAFNFFEPHHLHLFNKEYPVGPKLLVNIPDNLLEAIAYPNFDKIDTLAFWTSVFSITIIAGIVSMAVSKAVDKLDPYKRRTDLNKDLVGIGIGTMISGALGGLPIITVIVRSTVNVHNHAKTKWSNLYHGLLLMVFIFLLTPVVQQVPLCALAILLVFTGVKLASPKEFKHVYDHGVEQLIFFSGTLAITLFSGLLVGVFGGLLLALFVHFLMAKVSVLSFFKMIFDSGSNLFFKKDGSYELKIKGVANFLAAIQIDKLIDQVPRGVRVNIDLSEARLVGSSIMENLYDFKRAHESSGGMVKIGGMEQHISSSNHRLAMKILTSSAHKLTLREIRLKEMAEEYGWSFQSEPREAVDYFETFYFFKSRPIEEKSNCISGKDGEISWEISDVTFEEGVLIALEEYKTTLGLIKLPTRIPKFTIEKVGLFDKFLDIPGHKDIDHVLYNDFSSHYLVKVEDLDEMKNFVSNEMKALIEDNDIHHLESNGEAILIFNDHLKLANIRDYTRIFRFIEALKKLINESD